MELESQDYRAHGFGDIDSRLDIPGEKKLLKRRELGFVQCNDGRQLVMDFQKPLIEACGRARSDGAVINELLVFIDDRPPQDAVPGVDAENSHCASLIFIIIFSGMS